MRAAFAAGRREEAVEVARALARCAEDPDLLFAADARGALDGRAVVTWPGTGMPAGVGRSLLSSIGFSAGVTVSAEDYIATARLLADNPHLLAAARRNLRSDFARSPLGDRNDHAQTFEAALRAVWRLHCARDRP